MGLTEVFPVFTEEMVDDFEEQASPEDRAMLEDWYGTERVLNPQPEHADIVSVSLFWKNVRAADPDLPGPPQPGSSMMRGTRWRCSNCASTSPALHEHDPEKRTYELLTGTPEPNLVAGLKRKQSPLVGTGFFVQDPRIQHIIDRRTLALCGRAQNFSEGGNVVATRAAGRINQKLGHETVEPLVLA